MVTGAGEFGGGVGLCVHRRVDLERDAVRVPVLSIKRCRWRARDTSAKRPATASSSSPA
jgi:hypothetical protein